MKKTIKTTLILSIICIFFVECNGSRKADVSYIKNKHLDIAYSNIDEAQKLDIYLPNDYSKDKPLPIIVAIHGGAFMFGDKGDKQLNPMLEGLNRGYAIVSVNYRLSQKSKFPTQIHDVKASIRWIKANAKKYNLNPDKIAVWGGSAGGYLASIVGTSGTTKELEDLKLGNEKYNANVNVVIDWFGPIDFLEMDKQITQNGLGKANHNQENSPESKLLGKKITEIPELVKKANPETYISTNTPAFFIQHGTKDNQIPMQQSINFYEKLGKVLGKENVKINLLEGASHGGKEFETKENIAMIFNFIDKHLK